MLILTWECWDSHFSPGAYRCTLGPRFTFKPIFPSWSSHSTDFPGDYIKLTLPSWGLYTQTHNRVLKLTLTLTAYILRLSYLHRDTGFTLRITPNYTVHPGTHIQAHTSIVVFTIPVEFRTQIHPCFLLVYGVYKGGWGEEQRLLQDLSPPKVWSRLSLVLCANGEVGRKY